MNNKKLYVVGIGPGAMEHMTLKAINAIKEAEVIVGYTPYIEYVKDLINDKEVISTGMRQEIQRVKSAINCAKEGKVTAIISTGDAGLYGMAGPILEMIGENPEVEAEVVPGITSAFSSASHLGAPLMHDTALISLSDLLTPWDLILKRIEAASMGDFIIALYNPKSKNRPNNLKESVELILKYKNSNTPVGIVKNAGREGLKVTYTTLGEIDYEEVDMMTTVIIGNKATKMVNGKMVTPRGYNI